MLQPFEQREKLWLGNNLLHLYANRQVRHVAGPVSQGMLAGRNYETCLLFCIPRWNILPSNIRMTPTVLTY